MKFKLHYLRKHAAQKFVKDVFEKEFYVQKLMLNRAKKVCDFDLYLRKS